MAYTIYTKPIEHKQGTSNYKIVTQNDQNVIEIYKFIENTKIFKHLSTFSIIRKFVVRHFGARGRGSLLRAS